MDDFFRTLRNTEPLSTRINMELSTKSKPTRFSRWFTLGCSLPQDVAVTKRNFVGHLPPEIGSIIQDFARPVLRYPGEYKQAMEAVARFKRLMEVGDWPLLKAALSSNDADDVVLYVRAFIEATTEVLYHVRTYIEVWSLDEEEKIPYMLGRRPMLGVEHKIQKDAYMELTKRLERKKIDTL